MSDRIPIIFIIGAGRSGSTLLDLVLGSHSKIFGTGELSNWVFNRERQMQMPCTCGKSLAECEFWQKIFGDIPVDLKIRDSKLKIYRNKIDFLFNKRKHFFLIGKKKREDDIGRYLELNKIIYENILRESGKQVIVDSSKEMDRVNLLLNDDRFRVIMIHLVRDGRGTTYSYKRRHGGFLHPMMMWGPKNIKAEIMRMRHPDKYLFVRYEELCDDPERIIRMVLRKVGLEFEPSMMNYRAEIHHQVDGNPLRIRDNHELIKEDLAWKNSLPFLDRVVFQIIFGWLNFIYKRRKS